MSAMNDHARLLSSAIATSRLRLLRFLVLMYVLAFIDRANVGYARAFLQADTGLGDAAFAFGASIFFIGYACFEVPSNLMLHRLGARVWLCRIMVTWGLVSAAMMFADDAMTFYVLRFLLGVAEAGFFPASSSTSPTGSRSAAVPRRSACSISACRWRWCWAVRCPAGCWSSTASSAWPTGSGCSSPRACWPRWSALPPTSTWSTARAMPAG